MLNNTNKLERSEIPPDKHLIFALKYEEKLKTFLKTLMIKCLSNLLYNNDTHLLVLAWYFVWSG